MAARPILSLVAIVLLAGGIVLQMLIILSGLKGSPVNQVYFIQTTTNGIPHMSSDYHNPARWTYLNICGVGPSGLNADCGKKHPAIPFDLVKNFGTTTGVPETLRSKKFFYLSRVSWAFYLIALFFAAMALLISLFALCARLGAYLTGLTTFIAAITQAVAAALMTSWTVMAHKDLKNANQTPKYGEKAYAFTWAAFAAFFLATLFFCVGGSSSSKNSGSQKSGGYFSRKRSTRSGGGGFGESSGRRVKDEYE